MFNFLKPKITVVTHNGSFHADEVFGCAVLSLWAEKEGKKIIIIRTRDKAEIDKADIVLDVGNIYDSEKNRYDHHQRGGAGNHESILDTTINIPYASFGLIWKNFGQKITDKESAAILENKLVMPIDAKDNGVEISPAHLGISEYTFDDAIKAIKNSLPERDIDKAFTIAKELAKNIIVGEIAKAKAKIEGFSKTKKMIEAQKQPKILILNDFIVWDDAVAEEKNIKFVIYPERNNMDWCIQTVREGENEFHSETDRAKFPENWRGLREKELENTSGVSGAIFCHQGGWFAVAWSKEAAVAMAQKALAMASEER